MKSLTGKTALVTGAGRGIGRAIAELLAHEGAEVMLTARTQSQLEETQTRIDDAGGHAHVMAGEITSEAFIQALFQKARDRWGKLDILVNNAGIAPFGPIEDMPAEQFRTCLEVNILGPFLCMQQAVRLMKETGGTGKIVNIGSVRSHWTEAGDAGAYNTSKAGLRAMTESVARQLHGSGLNIAVGLVCPGVVDTTLTNPNREPRPGWLQPETIAQAVLHAVQAPADVNVFDVTVFPTAQKPW